MTQPFWLFVIAKRITDNADGKLVMMIDNGTVSLSSQAAPAGYTYAGGAGFYFNGFALNTVYAYGCLYSNEQSYIITNSVAIPPAVQLGTGNAAHLEVAVLETQTESMEALYRKC